VVLNGELWILASCLLRPISRNSVLEEFSVRRKFDLEHSEGNLCWSRSESEGSRGRVECHLRRGDALGNKRK